MFWNLRGSLWADSVAFSAILATSQNAKLDLSLQSDLSDGCNPLDIESMAECGKKEKQVTCLFF